MLFGLSKSLLNLRLLINVQVLLTCHFKRITILESYKDSKGAGWQDRHDRDHALGKLKI